MNQLQQRPARINFLRLYRVYTRLYQSGFETAQTAVGTGAESSEPARAPAGVVLRSCMRSQIGTTLRNARGSELAGQPSAKQLAMTRLGAVPLPPGTLVMVAAVLLLGPVQRQASATADKSAAQHRARGVQLDSEGRMQEAIAEFELATQSEPYLAGAWNDYGVALMRQGNAAAPAVAAAMYTKAEEALTRSIELKYDKGAESNLQLVRQSIQQSGGKEREGTAGEDSTPKTSRSTAGGGGNERLLSIKCDPKRLQINVSADAAAGNTYLTRKLRNRATKALAACGVVVLKGAFAKTHIAALRKSAEDQLQEWFSTGLKPAGIDKRVEHTEFRDTPEVSCRSTGRWEVKVPLRPPWTDEETIRNPLVTDVLVTAMDSSRLEMDTYSVVTSLSETPIQHWHRDAAALFEAPHSGAAAHPRPHGIVVFVPLDDVPQERGPTEFLLRSHIQCAADQQYEGKLDGGPDPALPAGSPRRTLLITECPHSFDSGTWKATAETGDAILFDLRILHRGGENVSPGPRPQIYATYTRYLHASRQFGRASLSFGQAWPLTCFEMPCGALQRVVRRLGQLSHKANARIR